MTGHGSHTPFISILGGEVLAQFSTDAPIFHLNKEGTQLEVRFILQRNPAYMIMNAYLPSLFTMLMTTASLFLDEKLHFTTTIMLVLTCQLCLYTLIQSSLEGIPKTAYLKHIDYWNMFAMTVSLTNFFILFLLEILQTQRQMQKLFKTITRIAIPLITLIGVLTYWTMAGLLYFGYMD